jgi:hypothetical protein
VLLYQTGQRRERKGVKQDTTGRERVGIRHTNSSEKRKYERREERRGVAMTHTSTNSRE